MQIQLNNDDIETAVRNYVASMGLTQEVGAIDFTATRNPTGLTATIELTKKTGRVPMSSVRARTANKVEEAPADPVVTTDKETTCETAGPEETESANEEEVPFEGGKAVATKSLFGVAK